jgi:hypothetical protein
LRKVAAKCHLAFPVLLERELKYGCEASMRGRNLEVGLADGVSYSISVDKDNYTKSIDFVLRDSEADSKVAVGLTIDEMRELVNDLQAMILIAERK